MNESAIITRLKQGDIGGLEALVQVYQVRAVRAAFLITQDQHLAEDIVQSAFIRAYERIDQFDSARPFGPWFLRSVVNDAVKVVSRRKPQFSLDDTPEDPPDPALSPEDLIELADTQAAIWEALRQLSPEQRAVVVMRYYLDLTEAEIAEQQNSPSGTVKWRLHAARERLRILLAPWHFRSVKE